MYVAVLQARMTSNRLPGKVMAPLAGEPMIWRQIERLRRARHVSRVMVATSTAESDDALAGYLVSRGVCVFRGEPVDLLDRFARCAEAAPGATHIVRVKGDCPFIDPQLIDKAIAVSQATGAAYVSNRQAPGNMGGLYPSGMEIEVIAADALVQAAAAVRDPAARISPTAYIRNNPEVFAAAGFGAPARDLSAWNWRVKDSADLAFAKGVYEALHAADPGFGLGEVLDLLETRHDLGRYAA
jgi:spore coat polysaccharide biosynthesis protein SpsF